MTLCCSACDGEVGPDDYNAAWYGATEHRISEWPITTREGYWPNLIVPHPDHCMNTYGAALCATTTTGGFTAGAIVWHMFDEAARVDVGTVAY